MRPDHYLRLSCIANKMKQDKVIQVYRTLIERCKVDNPQLAMKANNSLVDHINKKYPEFISLISIYKK